ncbi:RagB/SusD family nutrient uptake outer membrane protein [Marinilabilia rubra]|uniref:RagB/SusD family nutrient uptake outer membrane protein n=1 Tax=Marinilabilia rubra TaxID=2162893 RepID=A0A2U2B786_9BACT|nr:RagB/SusD family nutrient uptake outer membrane protein [Marinilabilia rubra]PWD98912.1 RagB/SusD family nutrient uptake outer membrane protein [Marinilabilia rubra]
MKINKLLYVLGIAGLFLNACEEVKFGNEFLEKEPSVDVTADTIFNSLELSERYLWKGYTTLPYGLPTNWSAKGNKLGMDVLESMTDLCHSYLKWGGMNQLYYTGQYSAAVENEDKRTKYHYTYEQSWDGIRIGWNFIEKADRIPEGTQEYIDQLKAEAKMIIAVHYTDMFRHFGGLPWVNHAYKPTESTDLPRLTAKATMDSIVALIDEAIPDLPWVIEDPENWDGRFTQAAAMGLKTRVLLFGASPLFNDSEPYLAGEASEKNMTWHGSYDPALWDRAAQAAKDLLDRIDATGGYGLVNTGNPRQDFQDAYYKRGNGEVLISVRDRYQSPGKWAGGYYFYQSSAAYGTACPTKEYVDMFDMADGTPIDAPGSGLDPDDPWANRDPRLYETALINGDSFQGRAAELWIGGRERRNINHGGTKSGFGLRKFLLEQNWATSFGSVIHWPYLRLSEIYLSYAEALNEANGGPNAEAYAAVNRIRNRVGLSDLPAGLSQTEFREAVLKERACEFGYEEVRWFDIIRWKRNDLLQQKLHGVNTTQNADGSLNYEVFELPERYWQNNWSPKWYLSAFPPDEINKGYGLVQNPGWE